MLQELCPVTIAICVVGAVGVPGYHSDLPVPAVDGDRSVLHGGPRRPRHPRADQRAHHDVLRQAPGMRACVRVCV